VVGSSSAAMQAGLKTAAQRPAAITDLTAVATAARQRVVLVTVARPGRARAPRVSQAHRATTVVGTASPLTVVRVSAQRCVASSRLAAQPVRQRARWHAEIHVDLADWLRKGDLRVAFFMSARASHRLRWRHCQRAARLGARHFERRRDCLFVRHAQTGRQDISPAQRCRVGPVAHAARARRLHAAIAAMGVEI